MRFREIPRFVQWGRPVERRAGKKLEESDDGVAGWGGLLGNPDRSLFYVPAAGGELRLEVRNRLNRGGEMYPYRLHFDRVRPGFQLFTTPENLTVQRGGTAVLKVHLVREMGFVGEVEVWVGGLPGLKGWFRADQLFEPNADGADMLIPAMELRVSGLDKTWEVPLRVRGPDGTVVEGQTAVMIGPIYKGDWNFYRRPSGGSPDRCGGSFISSWSPSSGSRFRCGCKYWGRRCRNAR